MGAPKNRGPLDVVLRAALWFATIIGAACGGLTGDKGDHVEVQNAECVTCHADEYQATTKPPHKDVKFGTTCGDCHTQKAWVPAKFIHPFPLIGAHAQAGCVACHGSPPKYDGLPTQCVGCHLKDYTDKTGNVPGHQSFPTTCDDCHNTLAWKPASPLAHPFPLTGAHAVAECTSCHGDPMVTTGLPQDCFGCHKDKYDSSPYPGHQTFPTTCQDCHSTFAWKPAAGFKHLWPLLGAHGKLDCVACHNENPPVYKGKSTACVSCHKADFDGAPNHQKTNTKCDDCHNTIGWKPAANFVHPFALTGAHTATPCDKCHGDFSVKPPTDCVGCHLADYNASPYPGHQTFSKTCTDCHTTNAWVPASGAGHPEAKFPIASGAHKVFACNECHNPALGATNSLANTDCVGCHTGQHTHAKMDPKHKDVKNYPGTAGGPHFCHDCHPKGKAG